MKTTDPRTDVIFRKFKNGDIIALFPYDIESYKGDCLSYEHLGQHSNADYWGCVAKSKPARLSEYTPLMQELVSIGYELQVRQKVNTRKVNDAIIAFRKKNY